MNRTDLAIIDQLDAPNTRRVVLPLPKLSLELHLHSDGRFGGVLAMKRAIEAGPARRRR